MSASAPRSRKSSPQIALPESGERRQDRRVPVPAVAVVGGGSGKHLGIYDVSDLSCGGASLFGEGVLAPGELVELSVQLPAIPVLRLRGIVLRRQVTGPRGRRCALRFERLTPDEVTALQEALATPLPRPGNAVVLVVWNRPNGVSSLGRELAAAGTPPCSPPARSRRRPGCVWRAVGCRR